MALLGAGLAAAALFAAVQAGLVPAPDLEGMLTDLSDSLGAWTYALVGRSPSSRPAPSSGSSPPARRRSCSAASWPPRAASTSFPMLAITWAAAAMGDLASFALGRRLGRRFLVEHGGRIGVTPPRLERVEAFFSRHGGKAILIGRFIGLVRAVAPFLAGASAMRLRAFVPWSLLGTGLWAATFTLVGYAFHDSFSAAAGNLTHGALALAVIAAAVFGWRARHRRTKARARLLKKYE